MDPLLLAEIAVGVAALSIILALVAIVMLRKARRQLARLHSSAGELDMVTITTAHADQIEDLRKSVSRLGRKVDEVQADVAIYAKAIFEAACDVPLSPEEIQAIEAARPKELR